MKGWSVVVGMIAGIPLTVLVFGGVVFFWDILHQEEIFAYEVNGVDLKDYELKIEKVFYADKVSFIMTLTPHVCRISQGEPSCVLHGDEFNSSFGLMVPHSFMKEKPSQEEIQGGIRVKEFSPVLK